MDKLTKTSVQADESVLPLKAERFRSILRQQLPLLRHEYGVQSLWLFGSYVRGEDKPTSDLDLLVEFDDRPLSLLAFIKLENQLSDWLGVRVDLVEKQTLKPAIGRRILQEITLV